MLAGVCAFFAAVVVVVECSPDFGFEEYALGGLFVGVALFEGVVAGAVSALLAAFTHAGFVCFCGWPSG